MQWGYNLFYWMMYTYLITYDKHIAGSIEVMETSQKENLPEKIKHLLIKSDNPKALLLQECLYFISNEQANDILDHLLSGDHVTFSGLVLDALHKFLEAQ